jgi:hypothetical protein
MFAVGSNALALYMEKNHARSARELHALVSKGTLVSPTLAEVSARIHANSEADLWRD